MSTMDQWTAAVCADLGLDPSAADLRAVLDLTRDVAHGVARPAAPLTAYLVGVAVGRGLALPDAAARISALADGWGGEEAQAAPHHGRDLQTERSRLMPPAAWQAWFVTAPSRVKFPHCRPGPGEFGVPSLQAVRHGYRALTDLLIARRPAAGLL